MFHHDPGGTESVRITVPSCLVTWFIYLFISPPSTDPPLLQSENSSSPAKEREKLNALRSSGEQRSVIKILKPAKTLRRIKGPSRRSSAVVFFAPASFRSFNVPTYSARNLFAPARNVHRDRPPCTVR